MWPLQWTLPGLRRVKVLSQYSIQDECRDTQANIFNIEIDGIKWRIGRKKRREKHFERVKFGRKAYFIGEIVAQLSHDRV